MKIEGTKVQLFENTSGPLPLKTQITPTGDLPETIFISGSCSATEDGQKIGFELYVAGELASSSVVYADKANEHKTTIPVLFDYNIPFVFKDGNIQPVDIELRAIVGTQSDSNDMFNLTVIM